ncbi:putative nuclear envelope pore membrane protein POM 121B isoform X2 [Watersipora subatra]|uniref:putative nuclear envelope pore membrane protein POM 121B isoform X2 n=1 Tax=Watersipora subatra TaxID=2589382 RepID=UPI00355AF468
MGNAPSSGPGVAGAEEPARQAASVNNSHLHSTSRNGLSSSQAPSNPWTPSGTKPFVPATPTSAARLNGFSSPTVSRASRFNTSSDSIFSTSSPSAMRKSRSSRARHSLHQMGGSRLGVVPGIKYSSSHIPVNLPRRGSVRIPAADRITPGSNSKLFLSTHQQPVPSTGEVLDQLRNRMEKRKRDDGEGHKGEADNSNTHPVTVSPSFVDSKRRRHDSESTALTNHEFVTPSPIPMNNKTDSTANLARPSGVSTSTPVGVSPKRDGHLRTAIASSYSSSRRTMKRECPSGYEEPLYKRSINMNYLSSSRDSSRRGSPMPLDRDSESETASRISVTPLPSVKNSPRSSPAPSSNPASGSPVPPTLINPKLEPKVTFPSTEEPLSGFVATFEDREHDSNVNQRRANLLLGLEPDSPQIVMPIIKPTITIPETTTTSSAIQESVQAVSSESKASAGTSSTLKQMLSNTIDTLPTQVPQAAVTEDQAVSTSLLPTKPAESNKPTADSSVKVTFSLTAATTSPDEKLASGTSSAPLFSFGSGPASKASPVPSSLPSTGFTFPAASFSDSKKETVSVATTSDSLPPSFSFGPAKSSSSSTSGLFSSTCASKPLLSLASPNSTISTATTTTASTFSFGASNGNISGAFVSPAPTSSQSTSFPSAANSTAGPSFSFGGQKAETSVAAACKLGSSNSTSATTSVTPLFGFGAPVTTKPVATSTASSTTPFAFGSTPVSSSAPVFSFGKPASSTASTSGATIFGATTSTAPASSTSLTGFSFGSSLSVATSSSAPSATFSAPSATFSFGGQSTPTTSSQTSAFGTAAVSSSSAPAFSFGQPSASTSAFTFGQSNTKVTEATPLGQGSASLFGATTDNASGTSKLFTFGASNSSSSPFGVSMSFGTTTTASSTAFGTTTTSNSMFGASASSNVFGTPTTTSTLFSTAISSQPLTTGIFTATTSAGPAFGTSGGIFGTAASSNPASGGFNFGATATTSAASGVFGQSTTTSAAPAFNFGAASTTQSPFATASIGAAAAPFGAQRVPQFGSTMPPAANGGAMFSLGTAAKAAPRRRTRR